MKRMGKYIAIVLALVLAAGLLYIFKADAGEVHVIVLDSAENSDGTYTHTATYDGKAVTEYDYTWNVDPTTEHDEVKDCPAEYYTGTEPEDEAVYIAHDIYYYPELPAEDFEKVNYDGEDEWAYYYQIEGYTDYIFATLPVEGNGVPTQMMHSAEEAYENAVLHITKTGTYSIQGDWHGQIWIDLGDSDDTFSDKSAKVTIILNGVDITCTVAPAVVFYSVYECDNKWEDRDSYSAKVDTSKAGANIVIADGTENNLEGANVYRMLKAKYKSDETQTFSDVRLQKKARKMDAAVYSYVSMNIDGEKNGTGVLNVTSSYEGVDTELHMTMNGGNVNIFSQDDGININEDNVSVLTVNGGNLHILAGLGKEGDGVDSNGYLVINGGTVISSASSVYDSGLDSARGSYINGGVVLALGSTMDWAEADDSSSSGQVAMNLQFSNSQSSDEAIIVTDTDGKVVFAYDPDSDEVAGSKVRSYRGAVISCPELQVGEEYFVYVGGDVTGEETGGVYDVSTVTGFSDEAVQQCYSGTTLGMGFGGMGGMGDFDPKDFGGEMPQMPDGEERPQPGERPEGFDPSQMEGFDPEKFGGEPPQMPDGEDRPQPGDLPDGFDPSQMGDFVPGDFGAEQDDTSESSVYFKMTDKVNAFSSVKDSE